MKPKLLSQAQRARQATVLHWRFPPGFILQRDHQPPPDFPTQPTIADLRASLHSGMFIHYPQRRQSYYLLDVGPRASVVKALRAFRWSDDGIRGEDFPVRTLSILNIRPGFVDYS